MEQVEWTYVFLGIVLYLLGGVITYNIIYIELREDFSNFELFVSRVIFYCFWWVVAIAVFLFNTFTYEEKDDNG